MRVHVSNQHSSSQPLYETLFVKSYHVHVAKHFIMHHFQDIEKTKRSVPVSFESTIAHLESIHSERKVQVPHEWTVEGSKKKMTKGTVYITYT